MKCHEALIESIRHVYIKFHRSNNCRKLLRYVEWVKNLGLIISNTLGWTDAVVYTCNRVFAAVHTLKRMQGLLSFHIKLLLIKSLVFLYFNYCSSVINDMTEKLGLVHCLRIPIHRITTYNRSFTVNACRLWNSLPDSVKQTESRQRFVAELRRRYLYRMIMAGGGATPSIVTVRMEE
ncbi:hypothetical protein J6590_018116 [Homalodisca vitripennis]|nr:hypothetical protein J6590_018116 [Homalodisca vitripennis]